MIKSLNNMETSLYIRLGRLIIPYWPAILVSTISAIIYVVFNSLSIWLTASLINNILTDFDQLLKEHYHNKQEINGINDQLKYWTNELRLRENPKKILSKFCSQIGIDEDKRMYKWKPGIASYDGVWASHWYKSVIDSDSFTPEIKKDITLTDDEKRIVDMAMPIYEELLENSI